MICKSFEDLTIVQKHEITNKIQHLLQTYEGYHNAFKSLVDKAEREGLLTDINFVPEPLKLD